MISAATLATFSDFEKSHGYPSGSILNVCLVETGGSLLPSQKNGAGSGAVGLIQFMPSTAKALGLTTLQLSLMSVAEQLIYVDRYFAVNGYKSKILASKDFLDVYLAVFYPACIGKPDSYLITSNSSTLLYIQNKGVDFNHDGKLTRGDVRGFFTKQVTIIRKRLSLPAPVFSSSLPGSGVVFPLLLGVFAYLIFN